MATAKTDFSISANVQADTSQVQKTLNQQKFIIRTDIRTSDAEKSIQRLNNLTQNTSSLFQNGFERINTTIKTGQTGFDAYGNKLQGLTKYTETFKNAIGDVQQRITVMSEKGRILSSSTQTVANGISNISTETRSAIQNINGFENKITVVGKTMTDTAGNTQTVIERTREWTDASGRLNKEITTTNERGEQLAPTINTISEATNKVTSATNQASNANKNLGNSASQANKQMQGLGWTLSDAFKRLANFYLASLPLKAFQSAITNATEVVKNFDAAITEMGKVSDYSGEKLRRYTQDLADLGTEVARTTTEMTEAATGWLKAGYSEEDAALLSKYSALLQNTADEELSAADATSILVSQLKAYHMEAEEAIKVTDIINAVSAQQAVSSYDISQGLTVASAAMSTFGNSIEETTALLTAGTTIFQGRSTQVARGLNMIATRVAKNGDELKKYGVDINDANGQLKSTFQILQELSPAWDKMSKAEQVALGNTLAGTNQYKIFAAVMSQMDVAVESYDQALNSSGETMKQNAVYMDSIEAKTTAMKAEFEKLILGDGGLQNLHKVLLDVGTSLLQLANSDIGKVVIEITALTGAIMLLTTAVKSLTVAMATNPFLILVMALSAVVVIALECANAEDELTRAHRENIEAVKESTKEYENLSTQIDTLKNRLKDIENKKITLSNGEDLDILLKEEASLERQLKLLEAQAEIERKKAEEKAKQELNTTYDFVGTNGEIQELKRNEAIEQQIEMLKELQEEQDKLKEQANEYNEELSQLSDTGSNAYQELEEKIQENSEAQADLQYQIDETTDGFHDFLSDSNALADALTSTDEETQNLKNSLIESVEKGLNYFGETLFGETTDAIELTIEEQQKLIEQYQITEDEIANVIARNEEMTRSDAIEYIISQREQTEQLSDKTKELANSLGITTTELEGLKNKLGEVNLTNFLNQLAEIKQRISDTSTVIDNMQDALKIATDAFAEYNEKGYLTLDTFQSLMGVSAQYLAALINEKGQLEINQETLSNLVEQLKIAKIEELETAAAAQIQANHTQDADTASKNAKTSVDNLGSSVEATGNKALTAAGKVATFAASVKELSGISSEDWTKKDQETLDYFNDLAKDIAKMAVNITAAGNAASTAGKKGASAAKQAKDATKELNQELEKLKSQYEKVISYLKSEYDRKISELEKAKEKELKILDEEIDALEKEKDAEIEKIDEEIKKLKEEEETFEETTKEEINALKERKTELVKAIDEEIKALEKEEKEYKKNIEAKIKKLENEKKEFKKGI